MGEVQGKVGVYIFAMLPWEEVKKAKERYIRPMGCIEEARRGETEVEDRGRALSQESYYHSRTRSSAVC